MKLHRKGGREGVGWGVETVGREEERMKWWR